MKISQVVLIVAGSIIIGLGITYKIMVNREIERYSSTWTSMELAQAKANRVFVKNVTIEPKELLVNGVNLKFKDAWIEEHSQIKPYLIFFEKREMLGTYALQFTIENTYEEFIKVGAYFEEKGKGHSFGQLSNRDAFVFSDDIDSIKPHSISVGLEINNIETTGKSIKIIIP